MWYKYNSEINIQLIGNKPKKIIINNCSLFCPSIEELNENNYFIYQEPVLSKYEKKGELIKVDDYITNVVVEMTDNEKAKVDFDEKVQSYNWVENSWDFETALPLYPVRIKILAELIENTSATKDSTLVAFKDDLILRKCPYYRGQNGDRYYTVYIKGFLGNEEALLQSLPNYQSWIDNEKLIIQNINNLELIIL